MAQLPVKALRIGLCLALLILTSCRATGVQKLPGFSASPKTLPKTIKIVAWNAQKGQHPKFIQDLTTLIRNHQPDLILLQEAHLALSQTEQMGGYFAKSWRYPGPNGTEIGVTTLSRVSPIQIRPLPTRHREFFITAPKLSLLTVYPLPEGKHLLAVNVHLLVFERFGTLKLRTQLAELEQAMQQHKGPIIMAGDFNTWSQKRLEIVKTVAQTLGLTEVDSFPVGRTTADKNSKFINWLYGVDKDLPIDRVFYRGYDSIYSGILPYRSSDHQAVVVQLSLRR